MLGLFSISRLRLSSKIGRQYKRESPKNISGKIVLFLSGLNSCTSGAKDSAFAPVLIINAKNALLPHGFFKMVTIFGNFAKGAQWITLFQMARKKAKLLDIYIYFFYNLIYQKVMSEMSVLQLNRYNFTLKMASFCMLPPLQWLIHSEWFNPMHLTPSQDLHLFCHGPKTMIWSPI